MLRSLIEELPRIASEGRQEAQRIIERLSSGTRIGLQTNELVLPRKDVSGFFRGQVPNIPNDFNAALDGGTWMNPSCMATTCLLCRRCLQETLRPDCLH